MVQVVKPVTKDLQGVEDILSQWTDRQEVDKYVERIKNEIDGKTEFNMQFWAATEEEDILGIVGLSDPLPVVIQFSKTRKPCEIKILYVDGKQQGKGVGKVLVSFIEQEAKKQGYSELIVRTAKRYKFTAWGFYKKMGYLEVGELPGKVGQELMQVFGKVL